MKKQKNVHKQVSSDGENFFIVRYYVFIVVIAALESKEAMDKFLKGVNEFVEPMSEKKSQSDSETNTSDDKPFFASEKSTLIRNEVSDEFPVLFTSIHSPSWPDITNWNAEWIQKQLGMEIFDFFVGNCFCMFLLLV
jgi:hypothetical protein